MPGARVTISDVKGRIVRVTTADEAGLFVAEKLNPGEYVVAAELPLFVTAGLPVRVPSSAPLRLVLQAGGFAENVVVTGRRVETRLSETPQKIEIVDTADLERTVAADLTDTRCPASPSRCRTASVSDWGDVMSTTRSISTTRGDAGETSLAGGIRVSKGSLRVETYGAVDELNSSLGLARALSENPEIAALTETIQQELFRIGSSLATPAESPKPPVVIAPEAVDRLTAEVHRIEAIEGMLADWSIPGEHLAAAAYDVSRTICRRAERNLVRLQETGEVVSPAILPYLNRLSDLLWLFGRKLEHDAGVSGSLRAVTGKSGNRFSRAW